MLLRLVQFFKIRDTVHKIRLRFMFVQKKCVDQQLNTLIYTLQLQVRVQLKFFKLQVVLQSGNRSKLHKDKIVREQNCTKSYNCTKPNLHEGRKLHEGTNLHEGRKLYEGTKLHEDDFAPRVNFARVTFCTRVKKNKQIIKKKLLNEGRGQG